MKETTEYIDHISHSGTVRAVDAAHHTVTVVLHEEEDCGNCPAARLCSAAKSGADKSVTVSTPDAGKYRVGQSVEVIGTEQMHRKAIMLATVLPCIALVAVMVAVYLATGNQLAAALGGLGATIFFFVLLYLFRNKIAHEFNFTIQPK